MSKIKAATVGKPQINTDLAMGFATKEAPQAVKSESARKGGQSASGLVPPGDVRLTANIRRDLHLRIKNAAAQRQAEIGRGFTIGELIEELIEKHL